ncbi:MAG: hypothetical protein ACRD34_09640 [Bryobacteraceae bacterium]
MKNFTPLVLDPHAVDFPEQIAACPAGAGVYALRLAGSHTHIAWSASLPRRLQRLFLSYHKSQPAALAALRASVEAIECWLTGSRLESSLLLYRLTREYYPEDYRKRLRLRIPWFLALTRDVFPRLTILNRVPRASELTIGPFVTRDAAQHYESEVLGLFQIRRCTETLAPHPEHPGCIYGEMNQCLRPCQCAVSVEEYASEAQRAADFLGSNGKAALAALSGARDRASEEMEFEQAAQIQKRLERIQSASKLRDEMVADVSGFSGVALTPARGEKRFGLWPLVNGFWQEPVFAEFSAEQVAAKSLDQHLREMLAGALASPCTESNRLEHLALFSRWYFSSWRDGEWFPFRSGGHPDYRRLVREISKRAKSKEKEQPKPDRSG